MLHQRRLAAAVLADERDPLAGLDDQVDAVDRPDLPSGIDVDQALDRDAGHATSSGGMLDRQAGSVECPSQPDGRWHGHTQVLQARVAQDVRGGPVEHDPPRVQDQHPGSRSGPAGPSSAPR